MFAMFTSSSLSWPIWLHFLYNSHVLAIPFTSKDLQQLSPRETTDNSISMPIWVRYLFTPTKVTSALPSFFALTRLTSFPSCCSCCWAQDWRSVCIRSVLSEGVSDLLLPDPTQRYKMLLQINLLVGHKPRMPMPMPMELGRDGLGEQDALRVRFPQLLCLPI